MTVTLRNGGHFKGKKIAFLVFMSPASKRVGDIKLGAVVHPSLSKTLVSSITRGWNMWAPVVYFVSKNCKLLYRLQPNLEGSLLGVRATLCRELIASSDLIGRDIIGHNLETCSSDLHKIGNCRLLTTKFYFSFLCKSIGAHLVVAHLLEEDRET